MIKQYITHFCLLILSTVVYSQTPSFYFEINEDEMQLTFDVKVNQFEDIAGMQFSILWDTNVLSYNSIDYKLSQIIESDFNFSFLEDGAITLLWIDETFQSISLQDSTTLFSLQFGMDCQSKENTSAIVFSDAPLEINIIKLVDFTPQVIEANFDLYMFNTNGSITLNANLNHINCAGDDSGSIILDPNGSEPFLYEWSNGATTKDLYNLYAGEYYVTVIDANNCSTLDSFYLNESETLIVECDVVKPLCGQNNGEIALSIGGGNPPYYFIWNNGSTEKDLTELSGGTYNVTISDTFDCQITKEILLESSEQTWSIIDVFKQDVRCFGDNNGYIDVSISNAPILDYDWNNGLTSKDLFNLGPGLYQCTVSDLNGCQEMIGPFEIFEPNQMEIIDISVSDEFQNLSNGSIIVDIIGGIPPLNYNWSNGSSTSGINNLVAGDYFCTITDQNNCELITGPFTVGNISNSQHLEKEVIECFPNPFNELIFLRLDNIENKTVKVYSPIGNCILNDSIIHRFVSLDTKSWNQGIYYLFIYDENVLIKTFSIHKI